MNATTNPLTDADADALNALTDRDVRALTEPMTVFFADEGPAHVVYNENSTEAYTVDMDARDCSCPDSEHNIPKCDTDDVCKHIKRVDFTLGDREIPRAARQRIDWDLYSQNRLYGR